jgi:hypothetical protein
MIRTSILARLALSLLVSAPAAAFAAGPCAGPGPGSRVAAGEPGWTNVVPGNDNGQTFTVTRPRITGIEVELVTGNPRQDGSDTLTLALANPRGDVLAEVEQTIDSGQEGWLCFAMPEGGIDVRPGETLVLRLRDTGKVIFGWRYGKSTYRGGHTLMRNLDRSTSFAFHVHDAGAQPAS